MVERILELMEKNDVKAAKLTAELGLPHSSVTKWRQGEQKPSAKAIVKLADYFNVSADYLLGRTDERRLKETNGAGGGAMNLNDFPGAKLAIKHYFEAYGEIQPDEPMHERLCEMREGKSLPTLREAAHMQVLLAERQKEVPPLFFSLVLELAEADAGQRDGSEQPPSVRKVAEALQKKLACTALVDSEGFLTERAIEAIVSFVANNAQMLQKLVGEEQ